MHGQSNPPLRIRFLVWLEADLFLPVLHQINDQLDAEYRGRIGVGHVSFGTTGANSVDKHMATEQHAILHGILAYLSDHPNAQDTVEGIAEWWLLRQRIRDSVTATERALNELVERELVIRDEGPDGRWTYRLNQQQIGAVREILPRENQDMGWDR